MATEPPSPTFCYDAKIQPKTNVEPSWSNTSVFLGNDMQVFLEPLRAHGNSAEDCMGLLTDLKKKMQQTKLHACHLVQVEVFTPFLSSKLHKHNKPGLKCTNTIEKGRPYHKTITVTFTSRLFYIEDDYWRHTNDVGHNVHKMRHVQIILRNGFSQSGAR